MLVHPSLCHPHSQLPLHSTSDLHYKKESGKEEGNQEVCMDPETSLNETAANCSGQRGKWGKRTMRRGGW